MHIDFGLLTNQQTPINFNKKHIINPTHLVFRELNFNSTTRNYEYSRMDMRFPLTKLNMSDLEEILLNIDDYDNLKIPQESVIEDKILSIPLSVPAYLVLSISRNLGWLFDPKKLGVTLGNTEDGSDNHEYYENLWHYDETKSIFSILPVENCRMVAFSALPLPANPAGGSNVQPINFNLIDTRLTPVTVDPDIRYPGNGGTFDGDPPPPLLTASSGEPRQ